jgi:hypothetical protein
MGFWGTTPRSSLGEGPCRLAPEGRRLLQKKSGAGEDSAVSACVRLQSRACGRGLRSRRPHSSLISGLLELEGISKCKDSHCRSGRGYGLAPVKDPDQRPSSGRRRRTGGPYLDVPGAVCPRQLVVQPASAERQPFECTA